jgi:hypothetical protein
MFDDGALKGMFGSKGKYGENRVMRTFINCTLHQNLFSLFSVAKAAIASS